MLKDHIESFEIVKINFGGTKAILNDQHLLNDFNMVFIPNLEIIVPVFELQGDKF